MFTPTIQNSAFMRGLISSGIEANEIAEYLECHLHTVYRWKKFFLDNPDFFIVDARFLNGDIKKLSEEKIVNIKLLSEQNPFKPASKIAEELFLDCDVPTVRRVMKEELDLHCSAPATKNKLINLDKQRRVQFAQNHLNITKEQWRKTVFIDEKCFSTHKDGRLIVWRPKNMR